MMQRDGSLIQKLNRIPDEGFAIKLIDQNRYTKQILRSFKSKIISCSNSLVAMKFSNFDNGNLLDFESLVKCESFRVEAVVISHSDTQSLLL